MKFITITFQLLLAMSLLIAAIIVTFRPTRFKTFAILFSKSGLSRIAETVGIWVTLLATLVGIGVPFAVFFASCLAFVFSLLILLRAARLKASGVLVLSFSLVLSSVALAIIQPLGLKVLALPKADELSFQSVESRVVKTYDEGLWFEGIAVGEDGTIYLSGNRSLDFSRSDYYHSAQGELIARDTIGNEHLIFRTPKGFTSGVPVVAPDKFIYLTSHGEESNIWRIETSGKASQLAQFPNGAWPNGLDLGPDGMLYSPDSYLGIIWRVDPKSGHVTAAIKDPELLARPFVALAPGANGLHFRNRDLLVTVSDRTTVLSYSMDNEGKFGPAKVVASGIPGDDFAIGQDGSLFITTHPYNTIVQVSPSGDRTIIGKMKQHIVGPTGAAFGRTANERNFLYVVTDGGAFTDGPKAKGELVILLPYAK